MSEMEKQNLGGAPPAYSTPPVGHPLPDQQHNAASTGAYPPGMQPQPSQLQHQNTGGYGTPIGQHPDGTPIYAQHTGSAVQTPQELPSPQQMAHPPGSYMPQQQQQQQQQQQPQMMYAQHPGSQPMMVPPGQPMPTYQQHASQMSVPQQQPGMVYQQGGGMQGQTVMMTPVVPGAGQMYQTVVPIGALSATPAPIDCPSCKQRCITSVNYVSGDCTHLWALGFCVVVCLPCIPYLIESFKDVQHRCTKCGTCVATYKRSGGVQVHVM